MSAHAKPVLQKPPPIKFKSAPPPEAKSNELSTLLKVVLGVSAWLYYTLSCTDYYHFLDFLLIDCYHISI